LVINIEAAALWDATKHSQTLARNISELKGLNLSTEAFFIPRNRWQHSTKIPTVSLGSTQSSSTSYSCFRVAYLIIIFWNGLAQGCIWS
jgi:hypothetical protein